MKNSLKTRKKKVNYLSYFSMFLFLHIPEPIIFPTSERNNTDD